MSDNSKIFVPSHPNYNMPFFYNSISVLWVFYAADPEVLASYLEGTGLKPAIFDGKGLVSIDFQNYTAHLGTLLSGVNEVEYSIHAYPESATNVPTDISLDDYLIGQEATKTIGAFRLWVPADNCVAIDAGRWAFGERKFYTTFDYEVPSPNDPKAATWSYTVYEPPSAPCFKPPPDGDGLCEGDPCYPLYSTPAPNPKSAFLYKTKADFRHLVPAVGNAARASSSRRRRRFRTGPSSSIHSAGRRPEAPRRTRE